VRDVGAEKKADRKAASTGPWGHTFNQEGKKVKVYIPTRDEADEASGVKKEGYAGGATISHNHGNPAPDLTKDTKVSSVHRPGRSTSRPGTATPPSYGVKARDMTKNSNPHTRHKPLTPGRIREDKEMEESGKVCSCGKCNVCRQRAEKIKLADKAKQGSINLMKSRAMTGNPQKEGEEIKKAKDLRTVLEHYGDYPMATVSANNKESEKYYRDMSQHAGEYHHHKHMSHVFHKMGGDHEDEHGVTPLGEAHYYKHKHHEAMSAHHADHLVKEHGMDRGKMASLCHKHRDSAHDFTLALAAEGKEPLKKEKPNRGKWKFKSK
jgi:hypothetical protein